MSIAARLFGSEKRGSLQIANPRDPILARWFGGGNDTGAGITVTPDKALGLVAVFAAIALRADLLASTPLFLYKETDKGKEKAKTHPLYKILRDQPNEFQTAFEFREMMEGHLCMRGIAYAEIIAGSNTPVKALIPLHPDRIRSFKTPTGSIAFDYTPITGPSRVILWHEMFYLTGLGSDVLNPKSPLTLAKESLALSMAAEEFGGRYFGNGTVVSGTLQSPNALGDKSYDRLKTALKDNHKGFSNAHNPIILEEGLTWNAIGVKPEEAQFLETRKHGAELVSTLYRIPPHLLGIMSKSTSWGTGLEQQNIGLLQFTLGPQFDRWEGAIKRDLLTPEARKKFFPKHNVKGFMRGDSKARIAFYKGMFNMGVYSPNDILTLEDENTVDDGDQRFVPLNMIALDKAGEMQAGGSTDDGDDDDGDDDDDKEENSRLTSLILQTAKRIATRETNAVRRELEKGGDGFAKWATEFFNSNHIDLVAGALSVDRCIAESYVNETRKILIDAVVNKHPEKLNTWERSRVSELSVIGG